jgi:hypothetical protein
MVVVSLGATPAVAALSEVRVGSNGDLSYKAASSQVNDITVTAEGASVIVTDTGTEGITPGQGCEGDPVNPQRVTCGGGAGSPFPIDKIFVNASNLDDTVTLSATLPSELAGRAGNDTLNGGDGGDVLKGDDGDDVLNGNAGNDFLLGEDQLTGVIGNDVLSGGDGSDVLSYASTSGVTVDLNDTGPQNTIGAGTDTLSTIERINGSTTGSDILVGDAAANTFVGSGGDDTFYVAGGGSDVVVCGDGTDDVFSDRDDTVRYRFDPLVGSTCETVDDGEAPTRTTITSGPSGLTNDPTWQFDSDEPWAGFECTVVESGGDIDAGTWSPCRSGERVSPPTDGAWIFAVRAVDDQGNVAPRDSRDFILDATAPNTEVQGPSGTTSDPAPEFFFSSPDDPNATFVCGFDRAAFFECSTSVSPDPPLSDGEHFLEVAAIDALGNRDATPARISFRVDTSTPGPGPGDGPTPNPQNPPVQQAKIIIGSLVLISGNAVKMSRKGRVSISLTCAGATKCNGRLSITTAEPVSKRDRRLVTLGTKKFTIAANKKRRINVRFSKSKRRLAKRLKRFKAKAVIREIDLKGNVRISTRVFVLRAR